MGIEFSKHAKEQLKRRKISRKNVMVAVETGAKQTSFRQRNTYQSQVGKRTLEVVAIREGNKLIIITAYYT